MLTTRSRVFPALALLGTLAVIAGCATTTGGVGLALHPATTAASSAGASPSSPAPTDSPTPSSAAPSTAASSTTSAAPASSSAAPAAAAPPSTCPAGTCPQRISSSVGVGTVIVRDGTTPGDGLPAAVVELYTGGVAAAWVSVPDAEAIGLDCISDPHPNCVLVTQVGAHSTDGTVLRFTSTAIIRGETVLAGTPSMQPRDLNGDGWVDVAGLQNDYTPAYATGAVYWQTWLSDGSHLTSTGCSAHVHGQAADIPAAPLTMHC